MLTESNHSALLCQIPEILKNKTVDEILSLNGYKRNLPNIRFNESLRKIAYNTRSACGDIADNCVDAKASEVIITIEKDQNGKPNLIRFIDNGFGMTEDELDQALKLGSESPKDYQDLGTFGCGLKTASLSQGRGVRVITKSEDDGYFYSCQDLDVMMSANDWIKELREANEEEIKKFKTYIENDTGTIVEIYKLDHCDYSTVNGLAKSLSKHFGVIYRKFIKSKKISFFIQNEKVEAIDTIHDNNATELLDEKIQFEGNTITVKLYELQDYGQQINKQRSIGYELQGFHVFRNNREIMDGQTFGFFTKHPKYNFFRGEIYFDGNLDDFFSTDIKKSSIQLKQAIRDKIHELVKPYLLMQARKHNSKNASNKTKNINFDPLKKMIGDKLNLLQTPKTDKEKRKSPTTRNPKDKPEAETKPKRTRNPKNNKKPGFTNEVDFRFVALGGSYGPIWNPTIEGRRVVVELNEEHPFIVEHILPLYERGSMDAFNAVMVLMMAMSNYELKLSQQAEDFNAFVKMRSDVGSEVVTILN